MSRNLKDLSPWARTLVARVRSEIEVGEDILIAEGYIGSGRSRLDQKYHMDIYHKSILDWNQFKEDSIAEYKRLMGKKQDKKYTGPLSYKQIEEIKDITK